MDFSERSETRQHTINLEGTEVKAEPGTKILELVGEDRVRQERLVGALLNRHLVSLDAKLHYDQGLVLVRVGDDEARPVIRQATQHMFCSVMDKLYPGFRLEIGQSLLGGYFYQLFPPPGEPLPDLREVARKATEELDALRRSDKAFRTQTVSIESALSRLGALSESKRGLLQAWPHPLVNLVSINGKVDIQYGPYPLSSGVLPHAEVRAFPPGLVLQFATEENTTTGSGELLLSSYLETRSWNRMMGVATVGQLNAAMIADRAEEVISLSEALHQQKLVEIAQEIVARRDRVKMVCLAGPSSSGKSTVLQRLAIQLRVNGLQPLMVGLDHYYRDRRDLPNYESGEQDYEHPEALDLALLRDHLQALIQGKGVKVPRFDFIDGRRSDSSTWTELVGGEDKILLLEGLHALNPLLWREVLQPSQIFRIFISALTQLTIDEQNRIQTSKVRLLRRLVRDRRYRGTPAGDTLSRWRSVRAGEDQYIFPFQEECEAIFNTTLVYEAAVMKTFAMRYLLEVPRDHPRQGEAYQLLKFLDLFVPVFPDGIPMNSILREFIGGGSFDY